jgi:hypothetical protein
VKPERARTSFGAERPIVIGASLCLNMAAWRVEKCYDEFREHCIERHDLQENDTNAQMFMDLKEGTLTLWKDE